MVKKVINTEKHKRKDRETCCIMLMKENVKLKFIKHEKILYGGYIKLFNYNI